jgi:hypothetical protein
MPIQHGVDLGNHVFGLQGNFKPTFARVALLEAITDMRSLRDFTNDFALSSWSLAARASRSIPAV